MRLKVWKICLKWCPVSESFFGWKMIIQYSATIKAGTDKFSHFRDMWEQHSRRRRQGIMTDMILLGKESGRTIKVITSHLGWSCNFVETNLVNTGSPSGHLASVSAAWFHVRRHFQRRRSVCHVSRGFGRRHSGIRRLSLWGKRQDFRRYWKCGRCSQIHGKNWALLAAR